ncbi:hypothetical protein FSST1_009576 [Fusarium sambucinum]
MFAAASSCDLVALTETLHDWMDRCSWAFKVRPEPQDKEVGILCTIFQFFWLPAGFTDKDRFPKHASLDGPDSMVYRIWDGLDKKRG